MIRIIQTIFVTIAFAVNSLHAQNQVQTGAKPWTEVINEVIDSGYPQTFIDSLKSLHNISFPRGLRHAQKPFLNHPETLVFEASWGIVKAGYAELQYSPDNGDGIAFVTARAATGKLVTAFYRVRDFVRSTIDSRGVYPLVFEEHVQEGRYKAQRWAVLDQSSGVTYTHKKEAPSVPTPRFTLDFLSLVYYLRTMTLVPSDTFTLDCYADGKRWPVFMTVGKRSRVSVRSGSFNCIAVMPRMSAEGRIVSKKDNIVIFLTDDEIHMPVLIKAKIKVGSINAELVHYSRE